VLKPRLFPLLIPVFGLAAYSGSLMAEPVTLVVENGPSENRVDIVFVGDGYTAAEQPEFVTDVERAVAYYFEFEPYKDYASYFNVRAIELNSNESGADHPSENIERDTALDATYDCAGIERLICVNVGKTLDVINRSVDATHNMVAVVVGSQWHRRMLPPTISLFMRWVTALVCWRTNTPTETATAQWNPVN